MNSKRLIFTLIIGTLILFLWNVISWMILPFHSNSLTNIPDNAINMAQLQNTLLEDGVYHYPGLPKDNSAKSLNAIESKLENGPRITLMVYKKGSTNLFESSQFIWSLFINFLTVLILFFIVSKLKSHSIKAIVVTCATIAIIAILLSDLGEMNWHLFPLDYTFANAIDKLFPFCLIGLFFGLYTFKNYTSNNYLQD